MSALAKCRRASGHGPIEARTFFDVSFQRSYRDQNGHWKNTQSFDLNGLLALQHAVGLAIGKVLDLQVQDVSDRPDDADDIA